MITYDFTGKVAFVTGAAAGMGAATARAFAEAGASVAVVDRDAEAAARLVAELIDAGAVATAIGCDVSDEQQVKNAVDTTVSTCGRLDMPSTMLASCFHPWVLRRKLPMPSTSSSRSTCVEYGPR